jgi:lipopolysaccharide export system protein LptA
MRSAISGVTGFVLVLVTAMIAAAANQDTVPLGKASSQPIEIKSKKLSAKSLTGGVELTFDGEVELKQDNMTLSCDKMVVLYEEEKKLRTEPNISGTKNPKDIASSIKSAVGSGNVRIVKNELTAVAEKALYDAGKRTVTLAEGTPRVSQGPHVLSAPTITIYLEESRAELSGEVKGQFQPPVQKAESSQPIDITSNKLTAKGIVNGVELTFDGKVRFKQGDMTLSCDKMAVLYEEGRKPRVETDDPGKKNQKDMANSIKSAVGSGNVRIAKNELTAVAGKALFDSAKRTVTLAEGPPRVWQGPHVLSAPAITIYLDERRAELSGEVKGQLDPAGQKSATTTVPVNHSAPPLAKVSTQQIDITSSKLTAKGVEDGAELAFEGKVRLKQDDVALSCDKMLVLYEEGRKPQAETGGPGVETEDPEKRNSKDISSSIKSVIALGNVRIVKKELTAVAGKGMFDNSRRTVTLTEGPPRVWQGPHMLTAPTITIYLDESRAELLGGDKNGVTGILNPAKQEKEK